MVVGVLEGAVETKVRPAVVIASATDYALQDWHMAGLRAESHFRVYVLTIHRSELTIIGHLSDRDWNSVKTCIGYAFAK